MAVKALEVLLPAGALIEESFAADFLHAWHVWK
jgi:hypothetical protein